MANPMTSTSTGSYNSSRQTPAPRPYPFRVPTKDEFRITPGLIIHGLPEYHSKVDTSPALPNLPPTSIYYPEQDSRSISPLPISGLQLHSFGSSGLREKHSSSNQLASYHPREMVAADEEELTAVFPSSHDTVWPYNSLKGQAVLPGKSCESPTAMTPIPNLPRGVGLDADTSRKAKKGVPSPVNTKVAAALPGRQCNVHLVQPDAKVPKFRVGDHVQVRRWHENRGSYGPWSRGVVFEKMKTLVPTTGKTEIFYLVSNGDKLNRLLYAAHLGEIVVFDDRDTRAHTIAESLIPVEIPTKSKKSKRS